MMLSTFEPPIDPPEPDGRWIVRFKNINDLAVQSPPTYPVKQMYYKNTFYEEPDFAIKNSHEYQGRLLNVYLKAINPIGFFIKFTDCMTQKTLTFKSIASNSEERFEKLFKPKLDKFINELRGSHDA